MPKTRSVSFSRFWSSSFLLLMAASWSLWTPNESTSSDPTYYPSIPMFVGIKQLVGIKLWGSIAGRVISLGLIAASSLLVLLGHANTERSRRVVRIGWAAVAILLLAAFTADQHRLQPWAYQTVLYAAFIALLGESRSLPNLRVIAISIYFLSALGKLDHQFLNTVGLDFLSTLLQWTGLSLDDWPARSRLVAAATFPICELAIALLLVIPRTRKVGGMGAVAMHLSLIVMLSPLGLSHSHGVLAWNAVLAVQAMLIFVQPDWLSSEGDTRPETQSVGLSPIGTVAAWLVVLVAIIAPMTERSGLWDHWQSWALYSPHSSRMIVELHSSVLSELPDWVAGAVLADDNQDHWHELDLSRWSLNTRGVPVVPQSRYQLALAIELAHAHDLSHQIRGILLSASDRWDGTRQETWLRNAGEIEEAANRFWLLPY